VKYSEISLLQTVSDLPGLVKTAGHLANGSLIEQTKPARVEPMVMIDETLRSKPWMEDVMLMLVNTIAGYYMQAVALAGTVGSVSVIKTLDKFNPSRSLLAGIEGFDEVTSTPESYKYQLPSPFTAPPVSGVGVEDVTDISSKEMREAPTLAAGKLIEVTIESEGVKKRIPVSVRLITTTLPSETLVAVMEGSIKGKNIADRWAGVKSGRLSFIKDFILCQDLIDQYREARMKDTHDIIGAISKRRNTNLAASVLSGNVSLATASNVIVISESTAKELESRTGLRLSDFRSREKYFANTYTMIMVVVHPVWDTVTIYHRSVELGSELSASELKTANRGGGPDIGGILQAYKIGSSPSLL